MAITKLSDFLDQLERAYESGTALSIGISPNLVGVLTDKLSRRNGEPPEPMALTRFEELQGKLVIGADTDTQVTVTIDSLLAVYLVDQLAAAKHRLPAQVRQLQSDLDTANAAIADLQEQLQEARSRAQRQDIHRADVDIAHTNLSAMSSYIRERLPKLNPARGHNDAADRAIDDICAAIEAGCDPTVVLALDDEAEKAKNILNPPGKEPRR